MITKSLKEQYEDYLNKTHTRKDCVSLIGRLELNIADTNTAFKYAKRSQYGLILRKYDAKAFNALFANWKKG